jgi:hypothetical protein
MHQLKLGWQDESRSKFELLTDEIEFYRQDLLNIELVNELEDYFQCSGMCQTSLFYFSQNITLGPPTATCLMKLK